MNEHDHVDVTITDKTKVPIKVVGWLLVGFLGCIGSIITVVLWASHVSEASASAVSRVTGVETKIESMETDIRLIRESQIRIETLYQVSPPQKKVGK